MPRKEQEKNQNLRFVERTNSSHEEFCRHDFDLSFLTERKEHPVNYQSLACLLLSTKFILQKQDENHTVSLYQTDCKQVFAVVFSRYFDREKHSILFPQSPFAEVYKELKSNIDRFVNNSKCPAFHVTITNDDVEMDFVYKVEGEEHVHDFLISPIHGTWSVDGIDQSLSQISDIFVFSLLHQTISKSIDPAGTYLVFAEDLMANGYCPWDPPEWIRYPSKATELYRYPSVQPS